MISAFFLALLSQLILFMAGLGMIQLVSPGRRIGLISNIPYAWGVGVCLLYLFAGIPLGFGWLTSLWYAPFVLTISIVIILGVKSYIGAEQRVQATEVSHKFSWLALLLILLLIIKLVLVGISALSNPIIDSDAIDEGRWIALAKYAAEIGYPGQRMGDPIGPTLLPMWVDLFLPRWHDNLIVLPWVTTYLCIVGLVFSIAYRTLGNLLSALVVAYFFSALPLLIAHTIRPGFSDLFVMYFVILASGSLLHFFTREYPLLSNNHALLYLVAAGIGSSLTKYEGVVWAVLIGYICIIRYVNTKYEISWLKIWCFQCCALLFIGICWLLTADLTYRLLEDMRDPIRSAFVPVFAPGYILIFAKQIFLYGSFNLLWWIFILMSLFVLTTGKATSRSLTGYCLAILSALLLFCCFTQSGVQHNVSGFIVGRISLQLSGLFLVVYCLCLRGIINLDHNWSMGFPTKKLIPHDQLPKFLVIL